MLTVWFLVLLNYTHIFPVIVNALITNNELPSIFSTSISVIEALILFSSLYITTKITNFLMKLTFITLR